MDTPTGPATGLAIVLRAWCQDAIDTVQGSWSIKVKYVFAWGWRLA
jgi:hypothetical protein